MIIIIRVVFIGLRVPFRIGREPLSRVTITRNNGEKNRLREREGGKKITHARNDKNPSGPRTVYDNIILGITYFFIFFMLLRTYLLYVLLFFFFFIRTRPRMSYNTIIRPEHTCNNK